MLSTASRQRAEGYIRRAISAGQNPWQTLDIYRQRGGRIGWRDWFRLWRAIARTTSPHPRTTPAPRGFEGAAPPSPHCEEPLTAPGRGRSVGRWVRGPAGRL
ncbi:MAG: hypothetical protein ACRDYF_02155 [Acidimicrobiia bacterium]